MSRVSSLLVGFGLCLSGVCGCAPAPLAPEAAPGEARRLSLNEKWRFFKGEGHGAEQPGFDDSSWRELDLPHDWAIEGPFDKAHGPSQGRKTRGVEPVTLPVGENVNAEGSVESPYRMAWDVPWQPGTLRAVAYRGGREVVTTEVTTAGPPARIRLEPDRAELIADGRDLSFVTVRIEDGDGNMCPFADNLVRFTVEGAGRREAVDNGNPASLEPFQADERKAFGGLALLIVRSEEGRPGSIRITAGSKDLESAETSLETLPGPTGGER